MRGVPGPASRGGILALVAAALLASCGGSGEAEPRTPDPAPTVELTPLDREVWTPGPPDRSRIPVLLYHGIAPAEDFANEDDAAYGLDQAGFAKQMTLLATAGYETITLDQLARFVGGEDVDLPPRPLLLTFDDARADSWTGGDAVLEQLGLNAVMFVDVGRVEDGDPEYLTWEELGLVEASDRWELQLHSGHGHQQIRYGPGPDDFGPYYAYEEEGETIDGWRERVFGDITWGEQTLGEHVAAYRPAAFAPPYGSYGQEGTNDGRIPAELLPWLVERFGLVFTQDVSFFAVPGQEQPLGRLQVTRDLTGGQLHELLTGEG